MDTEFDAITLEGSTLELSLAQSADVFKTRRDLFDSGPNYYVRRTNISNFTSYDFPLEIIYSDACRSSSLISKEIVFDLPEGDFISDYFEQSVAAFQDSVDQIPIYSIGSCGEKRVTLDPATPAFLKI